MHIVAKCCYDINNDSNEIMIDYMFGWTVPLKFLSFCLQLETHFLISQKWLLWKVCYRCLAESQRSFLFDVPMDYKQMFAIVLRRIQDRALEFCDLLRLWTRQHPIPTYKKQNNSGLDYQGFAFIDIGFVKILCRRAQSGIEFWVA